MKTSMYGAGAEYALHSLLVLAGQPGPVSVADLAAFQGIPEPFLAKLFSRLRKGGLVRGTEGIAGGFSLARPPEQIRFLDVLDAIDPGRILFSCAEIRHDCTLYREAPPAWATTGMCRIHAFMSEAEQALRLHLASKTLAELAGEFGCKAPPSFLRNADAWFRERRAGRTRKTDEGPASPTRNRKWSTT